MKKAMCLSLCLVVLVAFFTPLKSVSAYTGGYINKKPATIATTLRGDALDVTSLITDNDESTFYTLPKGQTITLDLGKVVTTNTLKLKASSRNIRINIYMPDNSYTGGAYMYNLYAGLPDGTSKNLNTNPFQYVTIASSNNQDVEIYEFDMINTDDLVLEPTPMPDPDPTPTPEPTGDRAILALTMTTGLEQEYDLSMEEVNSFISWYDAKDAGSGPSKYTINKHSNNKGPFSKRTAHVIFNNILMFEVNEYTVTTATYQ